MGFAHDVLGWNPYEEQREIAEEGVLKHDQTAVASAMGVGKTALAAWLTLWWVQTRDRSRAITTANTWEQVEKLLWQEIHGMHGEAKKPLAGRLLGTELKLGPGHFAMGISTDRPVRLRGHHAPGGILGVIDEADGVPFAQVQAMQSWMSSGGKLLAISNPTTRAGWFFECFDPTSRWAQFTLDAFAGLRAGIISQSHIDNIAHDCRPHPEKHPFYQVAILGQFPDEDESGLFPMTLLDRSALAEPRGQGRFMGVDVARFGDDACVALLLVDGRVSAIHTWRKCPLTQTAGIVRGLAEKWKVPGDNVRIDEVGLGAGVVDILHKEALNVEGVNFGASPVGDWAHVCGSSLTFANRRAELYWACRMLMEDGQLAVGDGYKELRRELSVMPYGFRSDKALELPKKEAVKKLLGHSPDQADALVLALSRASTTSHYAARSLRGPRHRRRLRR